MPTKGFDGPALIYAPLNQQSLPELVADRKAIHEEQKRGLSRKTTKVKSKLP